MNQSDHILELARHRRVLRAADVREQGWSPQLLIRLHQAGKLQRLGRGLYGLPDAEVTEHQTLIEVCQRVPKAVLCLLSALQFHEIGTQLPHEVWIALPEATQTPALSYPTLRITRLRGAASGAAAACGRVAAIIAPLLMPWFLTLSGGNKAVAFIVFAVAFILACVAALCLPERTGKELED